jgi:hypothetical protein
VHELTTTLGDMMVDRGETPTGPRPLILPGPLAPQGDDRSVAGASRVISDWGEGAQHLTYSAGSGRLQLRFGVHQPDLRIQLAQRVIAAPCQLARHRQRRALATQASPHGVVVRVIG